MCLQQTRTHIRRSVHERIIARTSSSQNSSSYGHLHENVSLHWNVWWTSWGKNVLYLVYIIDHSSIPRGPFFRSDLTPFLLCDVRSLCGFRTNRFDVSRFSSALHHIGAQKQVPSPRHGLFQWFILWSTTSHTVDQLTHYSTVQCSHFASIHDKDKHIGDTDQDARTGIQSGDCPTGVTQHSQQLHEKTR